MYWKLNKLQTQHAALEAAVTKGDATLIEILQKVRIIMIKTIGSMNILNIEHRSRTSN